MRLFQSKSCPNRAQNKAPRRGADVTGATIEVAQSHRSELNRRPLQSARVAFDGISRLFNKITHGFSSFLGRKAEKLAPQTVPKACLGRVIFLNPHTNPLLGHRFSEEGQRELERIAREELKRYGFRRWN